MKRVIILLCIALFCACKNGENWSEHYANTNKQVQNFVLKEKHPISIKGQDGAYGWSYTLISADNKILVVNNTNMLLPNYIK